MRLSSAFSAMFFVVQVISSVGRANPMLLQLISHLGCPWQLLDTLRKLRSPSGR